MRADISKFQFSSSVLCLVTFQDTLLQTVLSVSALGICYLYSTTAGVICFSLQRHKHL